MVMMGLPERLGTPWFIPKGDHVPVARVGCLEEYVSARGVKKTVLNILENSSEPSLLRSISKENIGAREVHTAAKKGDKLALQTFEETGKTLGFALSNSIAHTSPEAIFLFGGIAKSGEYLLEPTQRYMEHYLLNIFKHKVKLLLSGLHQKNAGVLGSAALIWNHLKKG